MITLTHIVALVPLRDEGSQDPRAVSMSHVDPARRWDSHQVVTAGLEIYARVIMTGAEGRARQAGNPTLVLHCTHSNKNN